MNSVCNGGPFKEAGKLIPNKSVHQNTHTQRSQGTPKAGHQHIKNLCLALPPSYEHPKKGALVIFFFKLSIFLVAFHHFLVGKTSPNKPLPKETLGFWTDTFPEWLQRLEAPLEVRGPAAVAVAVECTEVKPRRSRCMRRTELAPALLMPRGRSSGNWILDPPGKPVNRGLEMMCFFVSIVFVRFFLYCGGRRENEWLLEEVVVVFFWRWSIDVWLCLNRCKI